jgi:cell division protein ZapB
LADYIECIKDETNMLDIEAIIQQFELIEQKVEHVVQARKQLQKENEDLNITVLDNLKTRFMEKTEAEKKNEEMTALVRTKIDSLIGRLDGITEE